MAIVFPTSPSIGDLHPANPGTSGVTQYRYAGNFRWDVVTPLVSLGVQNQGAYNQYKWPATPGAPNEQLTTNGSGTLSWEVAAAPSLQLLQLDRPFNGNPTTGVSFTLYEFGTTTPFAPSPSTNLVVFLGGVPQIPTAAYSVPLGTSTINFTEAPLAGTTFYAISNIVA
jgi:hypothetical protein